MGPPDIPGAAVARYAVVQHPPVYFDRDATLELAVGLIAEAAREGADVITFPEAFVSGYPTWIWRLRPGGDFGVTTALHERLLAGAVDVDAGGLDVVCAAAAEAGVTVGIGLNEVDGTYSRSTVYNSFVLIGPDGRIANRHRKLMPTNPERMVWGQGDASGLRVIETPGGRIGVLICWENFMPLARFALCAEGMEVLLAPTWDSGEGWHGSMRHIAREARCWVVSGATALRASDLPADMPGRDELYGDPDEWVNPGDAVVVAPGGRVVAGPHTRERSILYADVEPRSVATERRSLDIAGHYNRADIFKLSVDRGVRPPIEFDG